MKRRFEITYYEYGMTRRKKKKFFFEFSAYLWKAWQEYWYGDFSCQIREVEDE